MTPTTTTQGTKRVMFQNFSTLPRVLTRFRSVADISNCSRVEWGYPPRNHFLHTPLLKKTIKSTITQIRGVTFMFCQTIRSDFTVGETFIIVGCLLSAITIPFDSPVKSAPNNFSYAKLDEESENRCFRF